MEAEQKTIERTVFDVSKTPYEILEGHDPAKYHCDMPWTSTDVYPLGNGEYKIVDNYSDRELCPHTAENFGTVWA